MPDQLAISTLQQIIEFVGTFAFAISGIRLAAAKHYDWFGGYVCGIAVAIGGGTIRDVLLGAVPFWMTSPVYMILTALALVFVILFTKYMKKMDITWLVFDTLGLALFTIAGLQKSLAYGQPYWIAIIMGCLTGAAGGVIRDVLLNNVPLIFQEDIYAMASVAGGLVYWFCAWIGMDNKTTVLLSFLVVCFIRFCAVRYHISLPVLRGEDDE